MDEILNANPPQVFWKSAVLAAAWGQLGDHRAAAGAVGDLLALKADFARTGRVHFEKWFGAPLADHLMEGLRKAGRGGGSATASLAEALAEAGRRVTTVFLGAVFRLLRDHARDAAGAVGFHPSRRLTTLDVAEVLAAVEPRLRRLLEGGGLRADAHGGYPEDGGVDPWVDEAPALAGLAAASVQGLVAFGRHSGTRVRRLGHARAPVDRPLSPCHARWHGLDLHAGLVIPAGQRDRLERVCRYALRPPVTSERLALTADGQVRLALRHPWADGTTHVVFDPVEFLGRLAVLVPRPRVNLILYYGVLGARGVEAGGRAAPAVRSGSRDGDGRSRGRRWSAGHRATPGARPAVGGTDAAHL